MHKLIIMIEPLDDWDAFEANWPEFLHQAEAMPGLRREATSRVARIFYGSCRCVRMHELYFDSYEDAERAMASPEGRAAGRLLQEMTGGRMSLFITEYQEDDLENIRRYRANQGPDRADLDETSGRSRI